MPDLIIGCHVSMSGKEMLYGSVKQALDYNANTFMFLYWSTAKHA